MSIILYMFLLPVVLLFLSYFGACLLLLPVAFFADMFGVEIYFELGVHAVALAFFLWTAPEFALKFYLDFNEELEKIALEDGAFWNSWRYKP